jgi:hypothetical protein
MGASMRFSTKPRARALRRGLVVAAALAACASSASAQQFHLYLLCAGKLVDAKGKSMAAHIDLAMRDNNMTALVQRSNVLPVGERMKYQASPVLYSMTMGFVGRTAAFYDWWRGTLWIWSPNLERLHEVRLSIDRNSAKLEGQLVDGKGDSLGRMAMTCTPKTNEDVQAPKF